MDLNDINKKKEVLNKAKHNLKSYFIGLDDIIDQIIDSINVWYLMPDLLTIPIIINLWGMTGVGKTDLIRRLVKELSFEDSYVEISLTTTADDFSSSSLQHRIKEEGLLSNSQGILLLDEMQKFRTVDEDGKLINTSYLDDIWSLLSDGKFTDYYKQISNLKKLLYEYLFDLDRDYNHEYKDEDDNSDGRRKKNYKFKNCYSSAERFKQELSVNSTTEDVMTWDIHKKVEMIKNRIKEVKQKDNNENYSKLLIFICGNLDEAYSMSGMTSEVNIDADILYNFSKEIDILNIKNCLKSKFKPEQIARLGNNHIIYPSISKLNYEKLIDRKLNNVKDRVKKQNNIDVFFDKNINKALYRNGVYPTQGTRPIFSTINNLIENSLPEFLLEATLNKVNKITIDIDEENQEIISYINNKKITKNVILQIDKIKNNISLDRLAKTAVHESGHALIYALNFKVAPPQIVGDSIGNNASGFVINHHIIQSNKNIIQQIQVFLAGLVAEELIFGKELKTNGASQDLIEATSLAASYIRSFNMGNKISVIVPITDRDAYSCNTDFDDTNQKIEEILTKQKSLVNKLLSNNIELYKEIVDKVFKLKRLLPEEFYEISKKYIPDIRLEDNSFVVSDNYNNLLETFIKGKTE